ncbi:metal ABC transporter substrate-binding protein [Aureimonas jatrophae]|uniref:Zinc/manganese transport system substrate-binding protein n=1 Tax=Aureimonas jatrophae TaxID=1166073 RepID=A0A1H0HC13_9HYPH|nr:metal ABC transporter substrate-binding protein [Aureimonas jatrophae]MBB3950516.1 zinc/manganese transport system substrate-binding protein [Aureimonas jatrophae]SDO16729.1 zinc/manganese transport system substrate-binding protein [Aureimonas jatrophae]
MRLSRTLLTLALSGSLLGFVSAARAEEPIRVVASFSILGDMVREIGGEHVAVTTLVGPDGDAHVYEPKPSDARALGAADLLVVNGLRFEGWLPRLVDTAGFKGHEVVATDGLAPIPFAGEDEHDHTEDAAHDHEAEHAAHEHGVDDPHAWQNLANGVVYAQNIVKGLTEADPAHAADYQAKGNSYVAAIQALDREVRSRLDAIPEARRKVVTSHDAFGYFGKAYGIAFIAPEGVSTEAEASAADVAQIIHQIRDENITAVFVENVTDPRLIDRIVAETGAKVGGTLYSDALSGPDGPASTYLAMFRNNLAQIVAALQP